MKGIILHGGHGTRLRPLTHTGPKQLLKIANKPMSQYALEDLRDAGITDIAIILGDIFPDKVKEFYGDGSRFGVTITYIFQNEPRGIAHAIGLCENFIGNDKFVVYLGDNILRKGLSSYVSTFSKSESSAMILLSEVSNPKQFGVAKIVNNILVEIIEKPENPPSNYAVIGVYFLTHEIFPIIKNLKPSWRNELEITDALQSLILTNKTPSYDFVNGWWKDTGTPNDILHANQLILESISELESTNSILENNIKIDSTAKIIPPVLFEKNCKILGNCTIGPYVSIGEKTTIIDSKIKNSIIMNDCIIDSNIMIENSIISDNTEITGNFNPKLTVILGERSKISF